MEEQHIRVLQPSIGTPQALTEPLEKNCNSKTLQNTSKFSAANVALQTHDVAGHLIIAATTEKG